MASILPRGVGLQRIGTTTSPITFGANAGATDLWTWAHNRGKRAERISVLEATSREEMPRAAVAAGAIGFLVTQTDANTITVQNMNNAGGNAPTVVLEILWEDHTLTKMGSLAATVGTLS